MNEEQIRLLIQLIQDVAEAVVDDNQSRGSDYAGMDLHRIKENASEFVEKFNQAGTSQ